MMVIFLVFMKQLDYFQHYSSFERMYVKGTSKGAVGSPFISTEHSNPETAWQ